MRQKTSVFTWKNFLLDSGYKSIRWLTIINLISSNAIILPYFYVFYLSFQNDTSGSTDKYINDVLIPYLSHFLLWFVFAYFISLIITFIFAFLLYQNKARNFILIIFLMELSPFIGFLMIASFN